MNNTIWETVIGLEVHVQVNSKTKAFVADENIFGDEPNSHISPVTLAHPGALPRTNKYQVEAATKLGLAFGGTINQESYFDRKNYFYPDLPKGYQITQDHCPISIGGAFTFPMPNSELKIVRIHHLHMEEDAGKSVHDIHPKYTLLDYNRAGVPLIEIVTEPDLRSSEEVFHFINYLQILVRNLGISDGNMEEGSFRCDCNVSVRKSGQKEYGTRCEIKNLNSKKFAKIAVDYEAGRQIKKIVNGDKINQTTMLFDAATNRTFPMRDKEDVNDYRYFNDPDLPPVIVSDEMLAEIKKQICPTPIENYTYLDELTQLDHTQKEVLISEEANMQLLKSMVEQDIPPREAALLLINKFIPNQENIPFWEIDNQQIISRSRDFTKLYLENKISKSAAYQKLYPLIWDNFDTKVEVIAEKHDLLMSSEELSLTPVLQDILAKNQDKVKAYNSGKKGLIGFFMGEAMRATKGKADPKKLKIELAKMLNK